MSLKVKKVFAHKTRVERITHLVEWCIQRGYTPRSSAWADKVLRYAATYMLSNRTIKDYLKTMKQVYGEDCWCSIALKSSNLTERQKQHWLKKAGLTLPRTDPTDLTRAFSRDAEVKPTNLKGLVFDFWDAFPTSNTKDTCDFYGISYNEKRGLIWKYRTQWRKREGFRKVPKIAKNRGRVVHKGEWRAVVPPLDRVAAQRFGWGLSKNRNAMLYFPEDGGSIGTIFWHRNGRVRLFLHEGYVTDGHVKSLFCDGFMPLIKNDRVLDVCLNHLRHVGGHLTVETRKRLPHVKVNNFKKSHGVGFVAGDRSHPRGFEFTYGIPNCMRPFEELLNQFASLCVLSAWEAKKGLPLIYVA